MHTYLLNERIYIHARTNSLIYEFSFFFIFYLVKRKNLHRFTMCAFIMINLKYLKFAHTYIYININIVCVLYTKAFTTAKHINHIENIRTNYFFSLSLSFFLFSHCFANSLLNAYALELMDEKCLKLIRMAVSSMHMYECMYGFRLYILLCLC